MKISDQAVKLGYDPDEWGDFIRGVGPKPVRLEDKAKPKKQKASAAKLAESDSSEGAGESS